MQSMQWETIVWITSMAQRASARYGFENRECIEKLRGYTVWVHNNKKINLRLLSKSTNKKVCKCFVCKWYPLGGTTHYNMSWMRNIRNSKLTALKYKMALIH